MPHSTDAASAYSRGYESFSLPDAFPKAAGTEIVSTTLSMPGRDGEPQFSPVLSNFSYEDRARPSSPLASGAHCSEQRFNTRPIEYGAPGEKKDAALRHSHYGTKQRTQYYEDQFGYKESATGTARERVSKDSVVIAELRTNIKDEYSLVTGLSHHLSTRYARPENSIMVGVDHSACLLLGGSFDPAYTLTITAIPSLLQPTTNKRNAALIQAFMTEILSVPADRGVVKFQHIAGENLATNGATLLGEIEKVDKQMAEENGGGIKRALTKSSRKSLSLRPKSSPQLQRKAQSPVPGTADTPPLPSPVSSPTMPEPPRENKEIDGLGIANGHGNRNPLRSHAVGDGNGYDGQNGTGTHSSTADGKFSYGLSSRPITAKDTTTALPKIPPPPSIPQEKTPKVSKRKSFLSVFRR
ncbi:hypothetical protein LTR04_004342 [Oleoguttula sp. CCFEE 6159]|nr:hypothetical protein LTR04_004342 [Oleoguttula sp. CCFEE 6159]